VIKNLIVELVEPIIISRNKIVSKNWIKVLNIDTNLFFSERQTIDKLIDDNLPWKRTIIGEVIYDNMAYRITNQQEEQKQKNFLEMPDFLGEGIFSIENIYSRIFEDATESYLQEYLREEPYYSETTPRKKFPYLGGKEIDVYGIKKAKETVIVVCECKFRLNGSPISKDEVQEFHEKTKVIKENEQKNLSRVYFCWWFVTNSDNITDESKELAKLEGIRIKKAVINRNWRKMSTWKITEMTDLV
jgi:hypothetical protein